VESENLKRTVSFNLLEYFIQREECSMGIEFVTWKPLKVFLILYDKISSERQERIVKPV
jgi:hypothetical protein